MNGDWLYEDKREFTVEVNSRLMAHSCAAPAVAPSITSLGELQVPSARCELAAWHRVMPYYTRT
jgi:hypothetical protein